MTFRNILRNNVTVRDPTRPDQAANALERYAMHANPGAGVAESYTLSGMLEMIARQSIVAPRFRIHLDADECDVYADKLEELGHSVLSGMWRTHARFRRGYPRITYVCEYVCEDACDTRDARGADASGGSP